MRNGFIWIFCAILLFILTPLFCESLIVKVVAEDGTVLYSSTLEGDYRSLSSRDFDIPASLSSAGNRILVFSSEDTIHTIAEYSAVLDDVSHASYADQAGWAHTAATALRTLGTTWADSSDTANFAWHADSANFATSANSASSALFADSSRISSFSDSSRIAATSDSARIASTVSDVPAGDADYIQNQNTAAQAADFWISGAGVIDDSLLVNGNAYINGKLTVTGGIDPIYLALTPQAGPPGVNYAMWVRSPDGALMYADTVSSVAIITQNDTIPASDFADSARISAFSDSARIANFADTTRIAAYADSAVFATNAYHSITSDSSIYCDTCDYTLQSLRADSALFSIWADSASWVTVALNADTALFALKADSSNWASASDTANFAFNADTANYAFAALNADSSIYSDSSSWASRSDTSIFADSANWAANADTAIYANQALRSDSAIYADTAGYVAWADSAVFADTADFAWFADSARIASFADSARIAATSDSARIASTVSNLPAGDADYIQNQNAGAQVGADFWIDGAGVIDDSLLVNGNAYIDGKLTVTGAIDPTYIVLTPQGASPGIPNAIWIDVATGEIIYNDGSGDSPIVTQNDTAVYCDSAVYADSTGAILWSDIVSVPTTIMMETENVSLLTNDAGYLTVESDPVYTASVASGIIASDTVNWNQAFSWGDHSLAGYLTVESDPVYSASVASGIIASDTVNWNSKLSSVDSTDIVTDAVQSDEIAANAVGNSELDNSANFTLSALLDITGGTLRIANGGAFPGSPQTGELFFWTMTPATVDSFCIYDGTNWDCVGIGGAD